MLRNSVRNSISLLVASFSVISIGCSKQPNTMVVQVENQIVAGPGNAAIRLYDLKRRHAKSASAPSPSISSQVTFDKAEILNRVFLYGSDLQYSTIGEKDGMLLQSLSIGHVTAKFLILGDRLQLVAEEKYRFESNINIPLRLLHEWKITHQDTDHVVVDIIQASPTLATLFDSESPLRSSWVRSVEFVAQGNYLLIESSIELADGRVAEFMESVFPRETLTVGASPALYDDASIEPLAQRFGFLSDAVWADLPNGRKKTAVASRFRVPPAGQTIDWYVTPNIPTAYLPAVKDGIEGWNRYSQKMFGRDLVKFKGVMPVGIKIGDPRYNVVNWDSVFAADAAYESQASDPETGAQSHSLIYLPYAWVEIGREFWKTGEFTQERSVVLKSALEKMSFLGKKIKTRCFNEGSLAAINPRMTKDGETFAKELLRGTLFHEVGHALGLGHNFKGSLEWNPDDETTSFTSSIMDYNQVVFEPQAFDAQLGYMGPIFEYDRQIISALYNDGKDIAANDRVLPYCSDNDADSRTGGVDPLCNQYDAGQDPSLLLQRSLDLIHDPMMTSGGMKSLASAAREAAMGTLGDASGITLETEVKKIEHNLKIQMSAMIKYYVSSGAESMSYLMGVNLRNLSTFRPDSLPITVDPVALRERTSALFDELVTLENFSTETRVAFEKIGDQSAGWLKQTPWFASAPAATKIELETSLRTVASDVLQEMEESLFPRVRNYQIKKLVRSSAAPFFFSTSVDYEAKVIGWLETILVKGLPSGVSYTVLERTTAAQTLATFSNIPSAEAVKNFAYSKVDKEISLATSADEREELRALLALLR